MDKRARAYLIAATVPCDHRSALKALEQGTGAIKCRALRDKIDAAIRDTEPGHDSQPPSRGAA